jgi:hypothetical protein
MLLGKNVASQQKCRIAIKIFRNMKINLISPIDEISNENLNFHIAVP